MYILKDSNDIFYGIFETENEAYEEIKRLVESFEFESYYYRLNFLEDGSQWIDYGSHSHFFHILNIPQEGV